MADRITFTRPAAERIGRAVRIVEAGDRVASPWEVDVREHGGVYRLRLGSFTGEWATGTYKVVTYTSGTQTTTTEVYNWTTPVVGDTADTACSRYVVFGKVSGTNSLVEVQLQSTCQTCTLSFGGIDMTDLPGYSAGEIQLLGHNESACLEWYSITTCETAAETVPDEYGWFY